MDPPRLKDCWPQLAAELEDALRYEGHDRLAASVSQLRVHDVCACGGWGCQSFYTTAPHGSWSALGRHETFTVRGLDAYLDVLDGDTILFVELLRSGRDGHYEALARRYRGTRERAPVPVGTHRDDPRPVRVVSAIQRSLFRFVQKRRQSATGTATFFPRFSL